MLDRDYIRFSRLRDGAVSGSYSLPERVLAGFEEVERLQEFQTARHESTSSTARRELAAAIVAAAQSGKPLPTGAEFIKAEAVDRAAQVRSTVLQEVLEERVMALVTLCASSAETIVADHLAPALEQVLEEARLPAEAVQGYDVTDTARLLGAPDDVRTAVLVLGDLAQRYAEIRKARATFRPELKVEHDLSGIFAECRNWHSAVPNYRAPNGPRPYPADPVGRLVWLVRSGAEPWMPLPAEQDRRWLEVFGEQAKSRRTAAAAAKMFAARGPELVR